MSPPSHLRLPTLNRLLTLPAPLRTLLVAQEGTQHQFIRSSTASCQRKAFFPSRSRRQIHTTTRAPQQAGPSSSSINPTEISHFSSLASTWWDPHGPSRLLHLMNPLRHRFITSCLSSQSSPHDPFSSLSYLDIGCGGGIFAESAARLSHTRGVTAVDPSRECIAVAREHARRDPVLLRREEEGRLRWLCCGVEELDEGMSPGEAASCGHGTQGEVQTGQGQKKGQGQYDIVTLFEVLEHVNDPSAFLAQATKHVRPGGWVVLSTIARTWTSFVTTKLFAEDILRIVPRGTHEWGKYLNVGEVQGWFEGQNARSPGVGGGRAWEGMRAMGVIYVPGFGWREVKGGEEWGNYFFAAKRAPIG